jgi:hypothetical protein
MQAGYWCSRQQKAATVCEFSTATAVNYDWLRTLDPQHLSKEHRHDLLIEALTATAPCEFTCRDCEKISQAPAPFHVIARGWAGASLLAMIVFEKFGQHQPLNRQAERYALEGVPIALSTMADAVGSV